MDVTSDAQSDLPFLLQLTYTNVKLGFALWVYDLYVGDRGIQKCHEIILSVFALSAAKNPQKEELTR